MQSTILINYIMKDRLLIPVLALFLAQGAQVYPQNSTENSWDNVLERLLSDEELSADAGSELTELYTSLHEQPININTAATDDLALLPFLTDRQIEDIEAYVYIHGAMKSLGELQLISSLDYDTRQILRHFVYVGEKPNEKPKINLEDVLRYGKNELMTRVDVPLYVRDGFKYHSPEELQRYPNRSYLGSRFSHSIRYSFNWQQRIRVGFTADKDAGEPFFGRNRAGYDFYSPYLYYKGSGTLRELAVGKFKIRLGRGLLMSSGFSMGKSAMLTQTERSVEGLQPHSSTSETGYLSGVGVTLGRGHTAFTLMTACTPMDATLWGDTLIRSIKTDGYHRTELEWSKKHNIKLQTGAVNVRYRFRGLSYGATFLAERLSMPWDEQEKSLGASAYWSLNRPRLGTTGELALLNGKPAAQGSLRLRLPHDCGLNMSLRYYSPAYKALHASSLAEGDVTNEIGALFALTHSTRNLKAAGYLDLFMHPEPRYGASDKSRGMDVRVEADMQAGRRDAFYLTARVKSKQKDCKPTGQLEYCITGRLRFRWTHDSRSGAQWRTQLLYTRYDFIAEPITNGWALTQSWSRSLFNDKLSVTAQAAGFRTDSYDSNVSVYEPGLRYTFNFLTLYGRGARMAMTLKYKPSDGIQLSMKAGSTCYFDRDEISSSQQRIDSGHKEDITVQMIVKF